MSALHTSLKNVLQYSPCLNIDNCINNNNNFIYTLESEVKLCSVLFTGSNAIQCINKYWNKTIRKIKSVIAFINYLSPKW